MELSIADLKDLLAPNTSNHTPQQPHDTPFDHLIGNRVLIRTYTSGVSIGTLDRVDQAGGMITVTLTDAVRIWRWENAFTVSELATNGGTCRIARHPDGIVITDQGAELVPVTGSAWQAITANWTEGAE